MVDQYERNAHLRLVIKTLKKTVPSIRLRNGRMLPRDQTRIMAILNVTDDSFSGDGQLSPELIVAQAHQALLEGAVMLDLGAESTRPGAMPISAARELSRLLPALQAVRSAFPDSILSIDTTKPEVFEHAYALGAAVLNTVAGLTQPLCETIAKLDCAVVIGHPGGRQRGSVEAVSADLLHDIRLAHEAGITAERILVDPGIGFGKTPEENLALLAALSQIVHLGCATVLGASRKSTLGLLTGQPVERRDIATSATTAIAAMNRVDLVRVHNVAAAQETLAVANAVSWQWRPVDWPVHLHTEGGKCKE